MDNGKFGTWVTFLDPKPPGTVTVAFFAVLSHYDGADGLLDKAQKEHENWSYQRMFEELKVKKLDVSGIEAALQKKPVDASQKPGTQAQPSTASKLTGRAHLAELQQRYAKPVQTGTPIMARVGTLHPVNEPGQPVNTGTPQTGATPANQTPAAASQQPAKGNPFFKGKPAGKPAGKPGVSKWLIIIGAIALLLLLGGGGYFMYSGGFGGGSSYNLSGAQDPYGSSVPTAPGTDTTGVQPYVEPVEPLSKAEKSDQSFWTGLTTKQVPELSPGNLNNVLSANKVFGLVLMVLLTVWAWGEGAIRRKSQQSATYFTMMGLVAGWITVPVLAWASTATHPGWVLVACVVLAYIWSKADSTIRSQSDLTPFLVALGIFTAVLYYYGKFTFITTLGALFGTTWAPWTGVTTLSGVITLLMTGRGSEAILTILIFFLGMAVIVMASIEVGKKHGMWASTLIAGAVLLTFALSSWGLRAGVDYLVSAQNTSVVTTVVLNVLAPVLAWMFSLLVSVGIGVALGDTEVGRAENRQALGLQKTGTFLQSIADFGILGTLIPLFFGVIIIFS